MEERVFPFLHVVVAGVFKTAQHFAASTFNFARIQRDRLGFKTVSGCGHFNVSGFSVGTNDGDKLTRLRFSVVVAIALLIRLNTVIESSQFTGAFNANRDFIFAEGTIRPSESVISIVT